MLEEKRFCPLCKEYKLIADYYKTKGSRNVWGVYGYCKKCYLGYNKNSKHNKGYFSYCAAKLLRKCTAKNIPFDLDADYLESIWTDTCPVFGCKLIKGSRGLASASVDRLIPFKGYVKGNVAWISWEANAKKNSSSIEDLEKILKYMRSKLQ